MKHQISLSAAIDMTTRFQATRPGMYPVSETFELASVQRLLAAAGAAHLRIYLGMKENGAVEMILVAADAAQNDLLPTNGVTAQSTTNTPIILEDGFRCPPSCTPSPLNP